MDSLRSEKTEKARVSELRDSLANKGMVFSPSRLSQIITSMVKDDLIVRKKPVPYEKGVVILELTEKGLQESGSNPAEGALWTLDPSLDPSLPDFATAVGDAEEDWDVDPDSM